MNPKANNKASQRSFIGNVRVALLLAILVVQIQVMKGQNEESSRLQAEAVTAPAAVVSSGKLTLAEAVELAVKQNLDIQIANIETASKQQDRSIARSELLPQASFEVEDGINRHNLRALLGIQIPIPGVPHTIGPYQAVYVGPTFSTPIFDLTLIREFQASGHRVLASRADEETVREETVLLTVSEYMAHLRALASITAAESRVGLAIRLAHQADDLLKDGVASKIDVSRAQVRLRDEEQQLIDARRNADTTIYGLKRILNVSDSQQIEFADEREFSRMASLEIQDPLATALTQRPELHSLSESIKADRLTHQAAVGRSVPKLTFGGFWNEQGETFNTATPGYLYQVSMTVPLFTGGRLRAERRSTALVQQRTQKELEQERNLVTEQVRDGQVELNAALHQVELSREEVELANEEIALSQGRFASGVTDNIEVTTAQDSLARANDAEIAALFRYNIARAQLAYAVGSVEQTYTHP
jgi:outer membrane protein